MQGVIPLDRAEGISNVDCCKGAVWVHPRRRSHLVDFYFCASGTTGSVLLWAYSFCYVCARDFHDRAYGKFE